eukprot:6202044-Pleurochrysis_carterae.AAC.3
MSEGHAESGDFALRPGGARASEGERSRQRNVRITLPPPSCLPSKLRCIEAIPYGVIKRAAQT